MGRRLKASSGKAPRRKASTVVTYSRLGGKGYSLPDAAFLMQQGYSDDHVAQTTGFDPRVVRHYLENEGVPESWTKAST